MAALAVVEVSAIVVVFEAASGRVAPELLFLVLA